MADVHSVLHEKDKAYFRQTREQRFGMSLGAVSADRGSHLPAFPQTLEPLRAVLKAQSYLGGRSRLMRITSCWAASKRRVA